MICTRQYRIISDQMGVLTFFRMYVPYDDHKKQKGGSACILQ